MKFGDIILALLIIFIFMMCNLVSYLSKGFKHIQNNWPEYRCNPMIMPFASHFGHDTEENFAQCIGQMQSSVSTVLTAPLHAGQKMLNDSISNASADMNSFRKLGGNLRPSIGGELANVFSVFLALILVSCDTCLPYEGANVIAKLVIIASLAASGTVVSAVMSDASGLPGKG